jgi:HJR/Mrr/RecB family endonuclease
MANEIYYLIAIIITIVLVGTLYLIVNRWRLGLSALADSNIYLKKRKEYSMSKNPNIKKKIELDNFEKSLIEDKTIQRPNIEMMNGYEFERFLGDLFKKMGYNVINTKLSVDQGADLIVERFGEKTVIQAKCYSDSVGNSTIQEAGAAKNHYHCDKVLVITTSFFTKPAIQLARDNNIELWNRTKLDEVVNKHW